MKHTEMFHIRVSVDETHNETHVSRTGIYEYNETDVSCMVYVDEEHNETDVSYTGICG
jgi:hypothetical protein